jgi:hypothetical protein
MYLNGPDLPIGEDSFAAFWFHLDYYECNGPTTVASSRGVFHLQECPFTLLKIDEQYRDQLIPIESMGRGMLALLTKLNIRTVGTELKLRTKTPITAELVHQEYVPIITETFEETSKSDFALLGSMSASIDTYVPKK